MSMCPVKEGLPKRRLLFYPFRGEEQELLDVTLVVLYEFYGKYIEAGKLHLSQEKPLHAIRTTKPISML